MSKTKIVKSAKKTNVKKVVKNVRRISNKSPKKKDKVTTIRHLFILDSSGSMYSVRDVTIEGFNKQVSVIAEAAKNGKQKQIVDFYTFADKPTEVFWNQNSNKLKKLTDDSYKPDGFTALNDAIGFAVTKLKEELKGRKDTDVIVTILTDGLENNSKEWVNTEKVRTLLRDVQDNLKWTVTFLGANIDVEHTAKSFGLNLSNTLKFTNNKAGASAAFHGMSSARSAYLQNASSVDYNLMSKSTSNFYSPTENVTDLTSSPFGSGVSQTGDSREQISETIPSDISSTLTIDPQGNLTISAKGNIALKPFSNQDEAFLKSAGKAIKDKTKKGV
jgi:hypothetical protein